MKKRIIAALLLPLLARVALAAVAPGAVTLESCEQGWDDDQLTLALKNNTADTITSVSYQLAFLNMDGKEMDYTSCTSDVTIAPGRTRKVSVPAYESARNYHYYKSEKLNDALTPAFDLKFTLTGYAGVPAAEPVEERAALPAADAGDDDETIVNEADTVLFEGGWLPDWRLDPDPRFEGLGAVLLCLAVFVMPLLLYLASYILVVVMARKRHRSVFLWVLLSLLLTPWIVIVLLLCLGDDRSSDEC